jgi:hypothetical protein
MGGGPARTPTPFEGRLRPLERTFSIGVAGVERAFSMSR